ncbi:transcription antitermination protein nusG [Firmicutes bacterium CAG:345]|mgnify:FL=1|nr:transcription antitermination protein nusG [Firmicutes bacterium CAG:345]
MSNDVNFGTKQWYVVNTYSGRERAVADMLEKRKYTQNLENYIFRIVVAEIVEPGMKNGKPTGKDVVKNLYPGYVFIEMIMTDDAWFMVRNTPDVTGFVGSSGKGTKPFPIPNEEIEPVLKRMNIIDENMFSNYKVGDHIRIISGSFENSEGTIESIDSETKKVSVSILFFGRPTTIEADFFEIELFDKKSNAD